MIAVVVVVVAALCLLGYEAVIEARDEPFGWPFRHYLSIEELVGDLDRSRQDAATPDRVAAARAEWVDPATLTAEPWTGEAMLIGDGGPPSERRDPCGKCGHPRWAHATRAYFDGLCVVPDCTGCKDSGYVPGT